jgi:DNA-directed RNA polymerase specialized sigma24 family protein
MEPSDDELLRLTGSDAAAFGMFYARHRLAVFRYTRCRVGNVEDCGGDITAEVFAEALVAAPRFRAGSVPARAWLFGIVNPHRRRAAAPRLRPAPRHHRDRLAPGRVVDYSRRRFSECWACQPMVELVLGAEARAALLSPTGERRAPWR